MINEKGHRNTNASAYCIYMGNRFRSTVLRIGKYKLFYIQYCPFFCSISFFTDCHWNQKRASKKTLQYYESFKHTIIAGILCGVALCAAANFQQFGIAAYPNGVAASGRAGFLTATYVIMVAVCAKFFGKKLHPIVWLSVIGCIAGMYLLCMSEGLSGLYIGDLLLLICAICYTCHILMIDRFTHIDSIKMSCVQFLVCTILSAIGMLIFESPDLPALSDAWFEIFYAGVMSSGVAYTLQMAGQKHAEPAVASIVMSLESVFAALAGWIILKERLNTLELIGCGLVFAAVIFAQLPEFMKKKADLS